MKYKTILFSSLLSLNLFSNQCKMDLILVNSGTKNAMDYELKKNYKYAIIELNEAITYAKQAINDCENIITNKDIDKLKKQIKLFTIHQKKLRKIIK